MVSHRPVEPARVSGNLSRQRIELAANASLQEVRKRPLLTVWDKEVGSRTVSERTRRKKRESVSRFPDENLEVWPL